MYFDTLCDILHGHDDFNLGKIGFIANGFLNLRVFMQLGPGTCGLKVFLTITIKYGFS